MASPAAHLARRITRCLQLLLAQLRLLRADTANARLLGLRAQLRGEAGITYLRTKFAALHQLPLLPPTPPPQPALAAQAAADVAARVAARLPRTAAWLRDTARTAEGVRAYLEAVGLRVEDPQVGG